MAATAPRARTAALWGGVSPGGSVALPDRVPLSNRPDGADGAGVPSIRLTQFLLLILPEFELASLIIVLKRRKRLIWECRSCHSILTGVNL